MAKRSKQSVLDRLPEAGGVVSRVAAVARKPGCVSARVGKRATPPLPSDAAARIGLVEGAAWTEAMRAAVAKEIDAGKARAYAVRAAVARPMSKKQLEMKLTRRGLERGRAQAVADELESRGVLNDAAFAHAAAAGELSRKPAGKSLLVNKLRSKGVDEKTARRAVEDVVKDREYDAMSGAMELAKRKMRSLARLEPAVAERRLYGQLARRGFEAEVCRAVVKSVLGKKADRDFE
jgi:regulatory protein